MTIRKLAVAVAVAVTAASAYAALSSRYADWAKGPVQFLMTTEEKNAWKNVQTDDQAQAFIDLFWARRDPTPATPANEFREAFEERVKYADEKFSTSRMKGSVSDRGRILILFGGPKTARSVTEAAAATGDQTSSAPGGITSGEQRTVRQTWHYEGDNIQQLFGTNSADIVFVDQFGSGDFRLERGRADVNGAAQKVVTAALRNPDLKSVPTYTTQAAPPPPPPAPMTPAAPAAPATSFKTPAYQQAIEEFRKATNNPYAGKLFVQWGEFVTPKGDYYVPVELYVPKSAGLTATNDLTFFGLVEDETGKPVAVFEEPAALTASKEDFYFDKSLVLPAGKDKAYFGLAQNGKPISLVSTEMKLSGSLDKSAAGISSLILSNNIYPLSKPQLPTDPYAFGGIKVVPKADRTFTKADELWYFFELRNPGVDSTQKPHIQVAADLDGKTKDGKPVKMRTPAQETEAQPLVGVPGHFAVGTALTLTDFKPGDYTLKLKVTDTITKQTYELSEAFKVVG